MKDRVGLGAQKLETKQGATREEWLRRNREMLSRVLNLRTTVAFVGAGCSAPLGYPTWTEFTAAATDYTLSALSGLPKQDNQDDNIARLIRFKETLDPGATRQPYQLPFILSACQRILHKCGVESDYRKFLRSIFQPRQVSSDSPNPHRAMLNLPIRRFITTNYDGEIERALIDIRSLSESEFALHAHTLDSSKRRRTFTQKPDYYDQLALFAMAHVEGAENMVFHCHGHYEDPDSMVVTEQDYQRWYLSEDEGADAFRQTIDLLFSSNPILFLGYGLGDDDLLRPLRMLAAASPERKQRPFFALLPERTEGEDNDYHEFLADRYGLNVIPYVSPSLKSRGKDLCDALESLGRDWGEWWSGLLTKPMIRKVEVPTQPPTPYHHFPMGRRRGAVFGDHRLNILLRDLQHAAEGGSRVIALIGPGGTGKSWCAQRLMKQMQGESTDFKGFFFWSSYYSYDLLTGLERALCYLDRGREIAGSRLERFAKCLQRDRYLLVFDGIERILLETPIPDEGRGFSSDATLFLEMIANPNSKSTVIITSRLWPQAIGLPETTPGIKRFPIHRFTTDDIETVEPFSWIRERHEISALCSLLDGHIYGLTLAAAQLQLAGKEKASSTLSLICRALSSTPPDRRTSRMIRKSIETLDEVWHGLALRLLERVAVFMSPVGDWTLEICYKSAMADHPKIEHRGLAKLIKDLVAANLLQAVVYTRQGINRTAYTLHPIVRSYVFQRVHHATTDALPDFTLPGFTAGTVVVDPGSADGVRVVKDVFNRLYDAATQARRDGDKEMAIGLCRSAFGVIRSRMGSNTTPRWSTYDAYIQFVIRLSNLAKNVSPRVWDYAERHDIEAVEDWHGPLYADELAWVYNEIGLTSYGEGAMLNALAVWEQGYEINRIIDSYEGGGSYLFQSQCNLGAAYIHFGRLDIAHLYLRQAERTNHRLNDPDHAGRISGYLALVEHLRGALRESDELYKKSIETLRDAGGNNRAESVFLCHYADLKMRLGEIDEARLIIQSSRSLADAGRYPDLVAYVRLSLGHWHRSQKNYAEALREYNVALNEARRIGIRRLESEALSELSRLAYDLGDAQIARQRAIEGLRIANESVLGLRQTHGLVVLGKATIEAGQRGLGIAYLKHAKRLADRQEYWLRGSEAEEELQRLGELPNIARTFK